MGLSKERRENLKVAGGWFLLIGAILLTGLCCAPMPHLRTPPAGRGAYPPLYTARATEEGLALSQCSWGRIDKYTVLTAAHCVGMNQGWFVTGMPGAPTICVDAERDSAYLAVTGDGPVSRVEYPEANPEVNDVVCYDSFRGRHNCGYIVRVFSDRFTMQLQEPIHPGDSGSLIYTYNGTVGVISRYVEGKPIGVGALLPRKCVK